MRALRRTIPRVVLAMALLAPALVADLPREARLARVAPLSETTAHASLWVTPGVSSAARREVAAVLDRTIEELSARTGTTLTRPLGVILTSRAEYSQVLQVVNWVGDSASLARMAERSAGMASPLAPWAVVVCQPSCTGNGTLRHELAHVLMYETIGTLRSPLVPAWFHEGAASMLEGHHEQPLDLRRLAELRVSGQSRQGTLPSLSDLRWQGSWNESNWPERYTAARAAVELYLRDVAPHSLADVVAALRAGSSLQDITARWSPRSLAAFEADLSNRIGSSSSGVTIDVLPARSGAWSGAPSRVIIAGLTPGESFRLERHQPTAMSVSWEKADSAGVFHEVQASSASGPWGLRVLRRSGDDHVAARPADCSIWRIVSGTRMAQLTCGLIFQDAAVTLDGDLALQP